MHCNLRPSDVALALDCEAVSEPAYQILTQLSNTRLTYFRGNRLSHQCSELSRPVVHQIWGCHRPFIDAPQICLTMADFLLCLDSRASQMPNFCTFRPSVKIGVGRAYFRVSI